MGGEGNAGMQGIAHITAASITCAFEKVLFHEILGESRGTRKMLNQKMGVEKTDTLYNIINDAANQITSVFTEEKDVCFAVYAEEMNPKATDIARKLGDALAKEVLGLSSRSRNVLLHVCGQTKTHVLHHLIVDAATTIDAILFFCGDIAEVPQKDKKTELLQFGQQ